MTAHRLAALEAITNVTVGYAVSVTLTAWLTGASLSQSAGWSTWFVLASLVRAYLLRRLFAQAHTSVLGWAGLQPVRSEPQPLTSITRLESR